ncbi:NAD(P)-dependent oxidoreductase [Novosphingobium sp. KA1]|uniref:NAD-dependent epimerase/dehydratase family protein n=1 Tax=Novosphingobium sp. (strain KA1) TaxID=164608 RepID=UPI001A8CF65D|nr:NAD(P)-dependent oxidoreductase [Novosphingobium sp. KA1]QSR15889.1 hypothetical protein CA833_01535 [Novosphingobium sp. KA1]
MADFVPAPRVFPGLDMAAAETLLASGRRIVVTGAGGWLGLATLELLEAALGGAFAGRVLAFGSGRRTLTLRSGRKVTQLPLRALTTIASQPTWLLHYAFLTRERAEAMSAQDYRAACRKITGMVLGSLDAIGCEAVFVASSGAAGLAVADAEGESPLGLYGAMKREEEERFVDWVYGRGPQPEREAPQRRRAAIARIFSLSGPYINKHDRYALAGLIGDALAGRPVVVRSPRLVVRSYVAIRELLSLAIALLGDTRGAAVTVFESGGEPCELETVARTVASGWPGVTYLRAPVTDPAVDRYHGDVAAYTHLLEHYGVAVVPLAEQVAETADWLARHGSAATPGGNVAFSGHGR